MLNRLLKKRRLKRGRELDPEEIFADSVNSSNFDRLLLEGRLERPIERVTFSISILLMAAGFLIIILRLIDLQYIQGDKYFSVSQKNISYTLFTAPPRGLIYDRNMKVLASNSASYALILKKKEFSGKEEFAAALQKSARMVGRTVEDIFIANNRVQNYEHAIHQDLFSPSLWPDEVVLTTDAPHDLLLLVATRPEDFKGVFIEESIRRVYAGGPALSPVVGFTGRPTQEDVSRSEFYLGGARIIGKSGIEAVYEKELRGGPGKKIIEIDAAGRPQRERFIDKPVFGKHIVLNIDLTLQRAAYEALARHIKAIGKKAGVVVISDPRDGRILALVNYPSFDPQIIADGKDIKEIRRILNDKNNPLFNRAIAGIYAPGSTVKPILAVAALEEGIIDPRRQIYDEGFISVPNPYDPARQTIFKDWAKLGWVDMRRALAYSANVYFYTIGGGYGDIKGLGIERIRKFLRLFGLGSPLGIDLIGEGGGLIPGPEEKKKIRPDDPFWRIGDTYITSIGQGDTGITPLQLNAATAAIANGGTLRRPFVTKAVLDESGNIVVEVKPQVLRSGFVNPEFFEVVREGMRMAVTEGSAKFLADFPLAVAGKTGTAETGIAGKNHGWFTGWVPYASPEIVITVLVEEGSGGSTDAVPIAKEILYSWLSSVRGSD